MMVSSIRWIRGKWWPWALLCLSINLIRTPKRGSTECKKALCMDMNTIEFSIRDQVAYLWLNRPEKRNALNAEMLGELLSILQTISDNEEARILVLRGKGKVF
ncbi:MAG: enoyl-CoA hydratase/isomerase family protein, partial [Bacteroidales bacterium]|nr:enoyl-CoA hydratase/isomerase family protein [Bacteroidales bacterium]